MFALKADIRNEDEVTAVVDKIVEEAGTLSGMVVNAGITNHKSALDFTKEEIERLFSINVGFEYKLQGLYISANSEF